MWALPIADCGEGPEHKEVGGEREVGLVGSLLVRTMMACLVCLGCSYGAQREHESLLSTSMGKRKRVMRAGKCFLTTCWGWLLIERGSRPTGGNDSYLVDCRKWMIVEFS